jgi:co-chaperonin GroES (HSP10)
MSTTIGIEPENDYVFVKHERIKRSVTSSGIQIAEVNRHADTISGTVVAVSDHSPYPLTVSVGDTVYFTEKDTKSKTTIDGEEYIVIAEKNLMAYHPN